MNATCCSHARGTGRASNASAGPEHRLLKAAASALPGAIAILLPKCPLCITAWIAASTGIALPAMVASSIRPSLVIACVLPAYLLVRRAAGRFRLTGKQ